MRALLMQVKSFRNIIRFIFLIHTSNIFHLHRFFPLFWLYQCYCFRLFQVTSFRYVCAVSFSLVPFFLVMCLCFHSLRFLQLTGQFISLMLQLFLFCFIFIIVIIVLFTCCCCNFCMSLIQPAFSVSSFRYKATRIQV